jgi:hypothetical protein
MAATSPESSRKRAARAAVPMVGIAVVVLLLLSSAPALLLGTGLRTTGPIVSDSAPALGASHITNLQTNGTTWRIRVTESGLPAGTTWRATVNGTTKHTTASLNTFQVPNGTYAWSITNVSGYTVNPQFGNVTVSNANTTVSVTFTAIATDGGGLLAKWWWVALVGLVILVILIVAVVRWRRHKTPPAAEWTPPESATTDLPPPPPPTDEGSMAGASPPPPTS